MRFEHFVHRALAELQRELTMRGSIIRDHEHRFQRIEKRISRNESRLDRLEEPPSPLQIAMQLVTPLAILAGATCLLVLSLRGELSAEVIASLLKTFTGS